MNEYNLSSDTAIGQRSSTGWLLKWNLGDKWIKSPSYIIYWGGESYAEILASALCNDLGIKTGFVKYNPCILVLNNTRILGCESMNFSTNTQFISMERLLRINGIQANIVGLQGYNKLLHIIKSLVDINYKKHLDNMLLLDYIICNYDRNLWNFGFLYNSKAKQFSIAPIFDSGNSFDLIRFESGDFYRESIIKYAAPFNITFDDKLKLIDKRLKSLELNNFNKQLGIIEQTLSVKNNLYSIVNPMPIDTIQYIKSMVQTNIHYLKMNGRI